MEGRYTKEQALEHVKELVGQFTEAADVLKTAAHVKEAQIEDVYIKPLFSFLNWNTTSRGLAPGREEFVVQASLRIGKSLKEPDYLLQTPDQKTGRMKKWLFIEAKHPKYDLRRETRYIRQAYQYAYSTLSSSDDTNNQVRLALLTDFEEFRLFDCWDSRPLERGQAELLNQYVVRPFEWTAWNYVDDFDLLWDTFERGQVAKGSLSPLVVTMEERVARRVPPDERFLSDLERWREDIARSMWRINKQVSDQLLTAAAQLIIDRLVFVKMLSDRGIEKDYLEELRTRLAAADSKDRETSLYDACHDVFRVLDKTYNGAIFARRPELDNVAIENSVIRQVMDDLSPENAIYTLAAMPVEILGNAYERFLGKTVKSDSHGLAIEEKPEVRKANGVYYTPRYIVDYIVEGTVGELLKGCKTPEDVAGVKILDPACGSGSFLLGAYDALLKWHVAFFEKDAARLMADKAKSLVSPKYKTLAVVFPLGEDSDRFLVRLTTKLRKQILVNNIFGVDLDPQAVEVAQFSLSMKAVEGSTRTELRQDVDLFHSTVLPDLGENIRCGNSVVGPEPSQLIPIDDMLEVKAFDWNGKHGFPDIMAAGGFDVLIGNPPYVRIQNLTKWSPVQASYIKRHYESSASGNGDLYLVFIEKSLELVGANGRVGLIVPNKFFTTDYGVGLRNFLLTSRSISRIIDFRYGQVFSGATTYTCLLFLNKAGQDEFAYATCEPAPGFAADGERRIENRKLSSDGWSFANDAEGALLTKLHSSGRPLSDLGVRIARGSSTGADTVFFLKRTPEGLVSRTGELVPAQEAALRIPLGGRDFGRYQFSPAAEDAVIFPYVPSATGYSLADETTLGSWGVLDYLRRHRDELEARKQYRKWFGYSAPRSLDVHDSAHLLVPLLADRGRCCLLPAEASKYLLMASGGFSVTVENRDHIDPCYLVAVLNSKALFWLLRKISNKFRGGWVTCTKQYVETLPILIPDKATSTDWAVYQTIIELVKKIGVLQMKLANTDLLQHRKALTSYVDGAEQEIDDLVNGLYGLDSEDKLIVEGECCAE